MSATTSTSRPLPPLRPSATARLDGDRLEFRCQRALKNYNSGDRHPHWSKKNRERNAWQVLLVMALVDGCGIKRTMELVSDKSGIYGARGACTTRRRVHVIRQVPKKANFIRDTFDNLPWCTKELRDALKQLALIKDDSAAWCEMSIEQAVSADGDWWTVIVIEPAASECR